MPVNYKNAFNFMFSLGETLSLIWSALLGAACLHILLFSAEVLRVVCNLCTSGNFYFICFQGCTHFCCLQKSAIDFLRLMIHIFLVPVNNIIFIKTLTGLILGSKKRNLDTQTISCIFRKLHLAGCFDCLFEGSISIMQTSLSIGYENVLFE